MSATALSVREPGRLALSRPHLLLAALLAASLLPVALVEIPAMVDYPNHLARMAILARAGGPHASPFYEAAWALYPNLAMDLLVPPLAALLGPETATRLFYLTGQLLVVSGAVAIATARGRPALRSGIAACLVLYSVPFAWGFVNFEFALGVALWAVAIRLRLRAPRLRFAVHALLVGILFVGHLFALGIYGFTVAVIETVRQVRARAGLRAIALDLAALALPALVMGLVLVATRGGVGGDRTEWGLSSKVLWLFFLNGWSREVSVALTAPLLLLGYVAARSGWLRLDRDGTWLGGAFLLLFVAMPFRVFDTAFADVRVLVGAALILPAFLEIRFPAGRPRQLAWGVLATVVATNLAFSAAVQAGYRADYRAMVASFRLLRPASHVMIADAGEGEDPPRDLLRYPMYHAATLAAHYADAEVPQLFTYPGKQPLVARPGAAAFEAAETGPVPIRFLAAIARGRRDPNAPAFLADWPRKAEYLYLLGPSVPNPLPELLEPMTSSRRFALYRVKPGRPLAGP